MRQQALILGALPLPFEGRWIHLGGSTWECQVITEPDFPIDGQIVLDIEGHDGTFECVPSRKTVSGLRARARILTKIEGVDRISVLLRERGPNGSVDRR